MAVVASLLCSDVPIASSRLLLLHHADISYCSLPLPSNPYWCLSLLQDMYGSRASHPSEPSQTTWTHFESTSHLRSSPTITTSSPSARSPQTKNRGSQSSTLSGTCGTACCHRRAKIEICPRSALLRYNTMICVMNYSCGHYWLCLFDRWPGVFAGMLQPAVFAECTDQGSHSKSTPHLPLSATTTATS